MGWFKKRAWLPPVDTGPVAFFDWTDADIDYVSAAIRKNGQPESDGFRTDARIALNMLRGGAAVELVARAIEAHHNSRHDPDRPITGNHYMEGMPAWCMWVEYAKPAVEAIMKRATSLADKGYGDRVAKIVPDDVRRLVIAARKVAFEGGGREELKELDQASEEFADRVGWNDAPAPANKSDGGK